MVLRTWHPAFCGFNGQVSLARIAIFKVLQGHVGTLAEVELEKTLDGKWKLHGYVHNMAQATNRMQSLTRSKQTTERPARKT
jgi:hypothetical protein